MHRYATQSTVTMPTEVAFVESPATHFSCTLRGAPLLCFHLLQGEFAPRDILLWLRRTGQFLPTLYLNSRAPNISKLALIALRPKMFFFLNIRHLPSVYIRCESEPMEDSVQHQTAEFGV